MKPLYKRDTLIIGDICEVKVERWHWWQKWEVLAVSPTGEASAMQLVMDGFSRPSSEIEREERSFRAHGRAPSNQIGNILDAERRAAIRCRLIEEAKVKILAMGDKTLLDEHEKTSAKQGETHIFAVGNARPATEEELNAEADRFNARMAAIELVASLRREFGEIIPKSRLTHAEKAAIEEVESLKRAALSCDDEEIAPVASWEWIKTERERSTAAHG
jgi:hypothetical protein